MIVSVLAKRVESVKECLRDASVNRGFSSRHRHVGRVGNECSALHDGLFPTFDFN